VILPALIALQLAALAPLDGGAEARVLTRSLVDQMVRASSSVKDATWIMHRREYRGGSLSGFERVEVKLRAPGDVFMRWTGKDEGRALIYRAGASTMRVKHGILRLDLELGSFLVRTSSRHDPTDASPAFLVKNIARDLARAERYPPTEARYIDLGERTLYGERGRCVRAELPRERDPGFYASIVELCMSLRTKLPLWAAASRVEDGELRLVEEYGFEQFQMNVGLTERDFDEKNPAYEF
jgi:hypothetical protein